MSSPEAHHPSGNIVTHLEVYKRAISLFKMSRHLATYITDNKDINNMYQSGNTSDSYSLQLVMDSMSLAPDIAEASITYDSKLKRYRIRRMKKTLIRIYRYCDYLEKRYEHSRDYVALLRKEIAHYRKAHNTWENNLLKK
ncbi:hypothetical protein SAMN05216480_101857 [Pustulibacterium marinum]|uniref:Four helix bundle protein n=1 Tax=Pustulibacterium marinum TaxID=1224947 RepID=A0A1I7FCP5_9FLAO|nr:hypothetical protein [Pustulibacterium marinum]SFU33942.1 hypothetical protein SAMN05216480_101857 [Pustulibacterium marinum]